MDLSLVARRLPEEFLAAPGLPVQRALLLVHRYWPSRPDHEQRQLAHSLLATLEPLLKSHRNLVTDALRDECEALVRAWSKARD
jgi:hypothetical protein